MKLVPDLLEAKHWIYPINRPRRDYQFNIAKHCFFDNTLVALPTGLGKTFIAGVIMLNCTLFVSCLRLRMLNPVLGSLSLVPGGKSGVRCTNKTIGHSTG